MKYFTGIDVSLRFVSICVVDEAGVVQYEEKVCGRSRCDRGRACAASVPRSSRLASRPVR